MNIDRIEHVAILQGLAIQRQQDIDTLVAALREIWRKAELGEPGICKLVDDTLRGVGGVPR